MKSFSPWNPWSCAAKYVQQTQDVFVFHGLVFYSVRFSCPLFSSRIYSGGCFQYFKHFLIRILYWSGEIIWLQCSGTNRSHGNRIRSETSYVWGERSTRPSLTEKWVWKQSISKKYRPTGTTLFLHIWSFGWIFGFILNLDHCVKTQEKIRILAQTCAELHLCGVSDSDWNQAQTTLPSDYWNTMKSSS